MGAICQYWWLVYWSGSFIVCVNNVITPISLLLFSPVRSIVPLSRNRGCATRTQVGKHKDKVLYRGIRVYVKDCSYSMCT